MHHKIVAFLGRHTSLSSVQVAMVATSALHSRRCGTGSVLPSSRLRSFAAFCRSFRMSLTYSCAASCGLLFDTPFAFMTRSAHVSRLRGGSAWFRPRAGGCRAATAVGGAGAGGAAAAAGSCVAAGAAWGTGLLHTGIAFDGRCCKTGIDRYR